MIRVLALEARMPVRAIPARSPSVLRLRTALAGLFAVLLAMVLAAPVEATTSITVEAAPNPATVGTLVMFSANYTSVPPQPKDADTVEVELVRGSDQLSVTVPLSRQGGTLREATWTGSATFGAGSWQVTVRATDVGGGVATADGGVLMVTTPAPTPMSTLTPTPPTMVPTPLPTPLPPGATPGPTVRPAPRPTPVRPTAIPTPTVTVSPSPPPATGATASPEIAATPSPREDASETADASASPGGSDAPLPRSAEVDPNGGGSLVPWLVLGGGMATTGATILVAQAVVVRRRRR